MEMKDDALSIAAVRGSPLVGTLTAIPPKPWPVRVLRLVGWCMVLAQFGEAFQGVSGPLALASNPAVLQGQVVQGLHVVIEGIA